MTVSSDKAPPEEALVLLEEDNARRIEETIRRNVEERLKSEEVKLEIERRIAEGKKKLFDEVDALLEKEKQEMLAEARRKQALDMMLEENSRRVEESPRREALELQQKEEEQPRESEMNRSQKEESAPRKKLEEE